MQIEAEKIVLAANGVEGLATVALRPSGIFGEWDRVFVPQLVDKAKQGKMKYIIGNGKNLMEWTYAKNVADAHVLVRPLTCLLVQLQRLLFSSFPYVVCAKPSEGILCAM